MISGSEPQFLCGEQVFIVYRSKRAELNHQDLLLRNFTNIFQHYLTFFS